MQGEIEPPCTVTAIRWEHFHDLMTMLSDDENQLGLVEHNTHFSLSSSKYSLQDEIQQLVVSYWFIKRRSSTRSISTM